jgi:hypothetical protein
LSLAPQIRDPADAHVGPTYAGEPYIWYQLTDGSDAGRYIYVAEQIDHLAAIGQTL